MTAAENTEKTPMDGAPEIDFDRFRPTRSAIQRRNIMDHFMWVLIAVAFVIACIPLISLLWTTIVNGIKRLNLNFLSYNMTGVVGGNQTPSGGYGGVLHAIIGTLEITAGAMVISIPIGLMCAVYLVEYSNRGKLATTVSLLVDVMSGIPSIVAGLFAFSMFTILLGPGTINGFEGSVALSLLMLPTVVKSSEEMLKIVPNDLREASLALGVTKQRTITKIVLRTALPGIVSGAILAIARVIGETAPLLMTAGYISSTNVNLFSGQMTTLPVFVYQEYSKLSANCPPNADATCVTTIPMERAWAAALVLIVIVLLLNLIGRIVAKVFAVKTEEHLLRRLSGRGRCEHQHRAEQGHLLHRPVRLRQVHRAAHLGPYARDHPWRSRRGRGAARRQEPVRQGRGSGGRAPRRRHGLPATEPVPDHVHP